MIAYPIHQYTPTLVTFEKKRCCSFNLENNAISRVQNNKERKAETTAVARSQALRNMRGRK